MGIKCRGEKFEKTTFNRCLSIDYLILVHDFFTLSFRLQTLSNAFMRIETLFIRIRFGGHRTFAPSI